jgi:hypothetical protein
MRQQQMVNTGISEADSFARKESLFFDKLLPDKGEWPLF